MTARRTEARLRKAESDQTGSRRLRTKLLEMQTQWSGPLLTFLGCRRLVRAGPGESGAERHPESPGNLAYQEPP